MRALIILAPAAVALAACQVTEDKANGQTTISYNQDVAENAGKDVVNAAGEAGAAITNDTKQAGAAVSEGARKAGDAARNVDVDVSVNNKAAANSSTPAKSN